VGTRVCNKIIITIVIIITVIMKVERMEGMGK
jgi:hypothetical protein